MVEKSRAGVVRSIVMIFPLVWQRCNRACSGSTAQIQSIVPAACGSDKLWQGCFQATADWRFGVNNRFARPGPFSCKREYHVGL